MKKFLKWTAIILGSIILLAVIAGVIANKPLPEGIQGPEADQLARDMETALNKTAWDSTGYVAWTYVGLHHFKWDRIRNWAEVSWRANKVLIDLNKIDGIAYVNGTRIEGAEAQELIQKAWSFYCNDSFWFIAPFKVFDPGTSRAIVELENASKGLLISYESGGVTPGDSYLWHLDNQNRPIAWQMWVGIIPIGGLQLSWENWKPLSTGAMISFTHQNKLATLEVTNVEAARTLIDVFPDEDPFAELSRMQ